MAVYFNDTEITGIKDLFPLSSKDITGLYFADTELFTVWGEYDGTLPAQYSANGSALVDYRVYGSAGGVGDATAQLFDPNATDTNNGYVIGKYLIASGVETAASNPNEWAISEYMECSPNKTYIVKTIGGNYNPAICFYDSSYNFLSGKNYNMQQAIGAESPANAAYVRFSIYRLDMPKNSLTLSPAPKSRVPYGYEVDMSVGSANLYDITTQIPVSVNSNKSRYIRVEASTTYTLWHNATDNIQRNLQLCNSNKEVIAEAPITKGVNQFTFNTTSNTAYVVIIYPASSTQVMLTKGSTAPSTYIPYSSTTTPIYIGDTTLGEGEYVSFEEQKVYRRTQNFFNYQSQNTENGYQDGKFIAQNGNIASSDLYAISEYIDVVEGLTYTWAFAINTFSTFSATAELLDQNKNRISVVAYGAASKSFSFEVPSGVKFIRATIYKPLANQAMLTTFTTSSYIPYYDLQDPPVPLPVLPTVDGVNVVDYAGQSAAVPSRFYAKYRKEGFK